MPRLYAGPLQPGRKSAKVAGLMSNRPRKVPLRLRSGATTYKKSRKASSRIQSFGETKLQAIRQVNNQAPVRMNPLGAPAPVYGTRFVIGPALAQYSNYNALQGMTWVRGSNADERIGNYLYMKKISLTMEINMNQVGETNSGPRRFRVIIFKARRYANPTGATSDPNRNLLLDSAGVAFGVGSATAEMLDYTRQITNKRDYQIVKDQTFILQNPVGNPSGGLDPFISTSGQYKGTKLIKCSLPLWRKTHFNNTTDLPDDVNFNYGIYVQSLNVGSTAAIPDDWTISVRGTVSCNDV